MVIKIEDLLPESRASARRRFLESANRLIAKGTSADPSDLSAVTEALSAVATDLFGAECRVRLIGAKAR